MQETPSSISSLKDLNIKAESLLGNKLFSRERLKFSINSLIIDVGVITFTFAACLTPFVFLLIPLVIFLWNASVFGECMMALNTVRTGVISASRYWKVFSKKYYYNAIKLQTLRAVYTFLWSLLIVPGYIKAASYALASYIQIEHPELLARESLAISSKLMRGHKKQYIQLMSYSPGKKFLFFCSLGNASLWNSPHSAMLMALFYEEIMSANSLMFIQECISEVIERRCSNNA